METLLPYLLIGALVVIIILIFTPLRGPIQRSASRIFLKMSVSQKARIMQECSHMIENKVVNPIIFLGDSITEGFPVYEFFWDKPVINRGISGDTTLWMLDRLYDGVTVLNPSKLFLLIGTNDLGNDKRPITQVEQNIKVILDRVKEESPETEIFLLSLTPVNRTDFSYYQTQVTVGIRNNQDIEDLNMKISLAAEARGIKFIDMYTPLLDEKGELAKIYSRDGLHLSIEGYQVFYSILNPYL